MANFQISAEAQGKPWSIETSSARNYVPHTISSRLPSSVSYPRFDGTHGAETIGNGNRMTSVQSYSASSGSMENSIVYNKLFSLLRLIFVNKLLSILTFIFGNRLFSVLRLVFINSS